MQAALLDAGAVPRLVAPRSGRVKTADGAQLEADASLENSPPVLFDALVLPDGEARSSASPGSVNRRVRRQPVPPLQDDPRARRAEALLQKAGVSPTLPSGEPDPGVIVGGADAIGRFIHAVGRHRHPERETDPPESERADG